MKRRFIAYGILIVAVLGIGLTIAYNLSKKEKVLDLTENGVGGHHTCPVHNLALSTERVPAFHGLFSPSASKEWWEQVKLARAKYPCAVPFPSQVEDPDVKEVVRLYCPKCRESFTEFVAQ